VNRLAVLHYVLHDIVHRFREVPDCLCAVTVRAERITASLFAPRDERTVDLGRRYRRSRGLTPRLGRRRFDASDPQENVNVQNAAMLPLPHDTP
jgi:hypothetical protein